MRFTCIFLASLSLKVSTNNLLPFKTTALSKATNCKHTDEAEDTEAEDGRKEKEHLRRIEILLFQYPQKLGRHIDLD